MVNSPEHSIEIACLHCTDIYNPRSVSYIKLQLSTDTFALIKKTIESNNRKTGDKLFQPAPLVLQLIEVLRKLFPLGNRFFQNIWKTASISYRSLTSSSSSTLKILKSLKRSSLAFISRRSTGYCLSQIMSKTIEKN